MNPSEQRRQYLAALMRVLKSPDDDDALHELLPDWSAAAHGVRFTSESSRRRRDYFARAVFPRLFTRALDPAQRERLRLAYLGAPAGTAPDWSLNAERVVAAVSALVTAGELPRAALDATQHEWALFEAQRRSAVPLLPASIDTYAANPTLEALAYDTDVAAWAACDTDGLPPPAAAGKEPPLVGYFRHPITLRARWRRLDAGVLSLLAVAEENLTAIEAAHSSGADPEGVQRGLDALVQEGLLLRNTA